VRPARAGSGNRVFHFNLKLHPLKSTVTRALLVPLDDRKRAVRRLACELRNRWMVMLK
jgi:hypothetical protein